MMGEEKKKPYAIALPRDGGGDDFLLCPRLRGKCPEGAKGVFVHQAACSATIGLTDQDQDRSVFTIPKVGSTLPAAVS